MSAEVLSLSEAAVESRMTPATLYIALMRGELTGRKLAKYWVVDRASFNKYLACGGAYGCAVLPLEVGGRRSLSGSHGHKNATTDPAQVKRRWARQLNNIGVARDASVGPLVRRSSSIEVGSHFLAG